MIQFALRIDIARPLLIEVTVMAPVTNRLSWDAGNAGDLRRTMPCRKKVQRTVDITPRPH